MAELLVNEEFIINYNTIVKIRIASEQFERKKDRSFLILGVYAITLESAAPVNMIIVARVEAI